MDHSDLDDMVDSYIECALWSSSNDLYNTSTCDKCGTRVGEYRSPYGSDWRDWSNEMDADCSEGGNHEVEDPEDHSEMLDGDYSADDIDDATLEEMRNDCRDFFEANSEDLTNMDPGQAGHDFWLTRNHHGAGFWDRGLGDLGDRLTKAAQVYGAADLMVDAEGTIHA